MWSIWRHFLIFACQCSTGCLRFSTCKRALFSLFCLAMWSSNLTSMRWMSHFYQKVSSWHLENQFKQTKKAILSLSLAWSTNNVDWFSSAAFTQRSGVWQCKNFCTAEISTALRAALSVWPEDTWITAKGLCNFALGYLYFFRWRFDWYLVSTLAVRNYIAFVMRDRQRIKLVINIATNIG